MLMSCTHSWSAIFDGQRRLYFGGTIILRPRSKFRPFGLSNNPERWHASVPNILREVNLNFRHDSKVDIVEGARKLRRNKHKLPEVSARLEDAEDKWDVLRNIYIQVGGVVVWARLLGQFTYTRIFRSKQAS